MPTSPFTPPNTAKFLPSHLFEDNLFKILIFSQKLTFKIIFRPEYFRHIIQKCPAAFPSLAAAHVSLAMGARGSDAALEQADVILMQDKIEKMLSALTISQRAKTIIRQNIAISLGAVILMATASILGQIPLTLSVLAHEGSTVVVCLNSLRLLFVKEPLTVQGHQGRLSGFP